MSQLTPSLNVKSALAEDRQACIFLLRVVMAAAFSAQPYNLVHPVPPSCTLGHTRDDLDLSKLRALLESMHVLDTKETNATQEQIYQLATELIMFHDDDQAQAQSQSQSQTQSQKNKLPKMKSLDMRTVLLEIEGSEIEQQLHNHKPNPQKNKLPKMKSLDMRTVLLEIEGSEIEQQLRNVRHAVDIKDDDVHQAGFCALFEVQETKANKFIFGERTKVHGSKFGFHGSATENWYSIIENGLVSAGSDNSSQGMTRKYAAQTQAMNKACSSSSSSAITQNGQVFGQGVYLTTDLSVARGFSPVGVGNWNAVAIVEYVDHPTVSKMTTKVSGTASALSLDLPESYVVVPDSGLLRVKYILIYSSKSLCGPNWVQDELGNNPKSSLYKAGPKKNLSVSNTTPVSATLISASSMAVGPSKIHQLLSELMNFVRRHAFMFIVLFYCLILFIGSDHYVYFKRRLYTYVFQYL
eukprot:CAMPEP_0184708512 /NCGR_PEP_ID=MMETSP0313-20130426/37816_1 /TAXON_ID=2792 /ORGANISM="Porphyridium aerugineum, Strain SAG 1380-2" /LENGTH=466 /DNA_ID=CAMNT_0027170105 /DNA_START=163 /DNA_END=1562 /DNA_ORIENTATION=+